MKIGILSMQRIRNYGSFLQAYGLKKTIESLGHDVSFIDYNFDKSLVKEKHIIKKKIVSNLNIYNYIKKKRVINNYNNKFDNEYIPTLYKKNNMNDIDVLVIGSDEVFNCLQGYPVGYAKEFFGYGYENKKVISYAASFGQTNYDDLLKFNISKEVSKMLRKFKAISVRDNNSYETIKKLTNINAPINLDPVLITDYSNEIIDNVKLKDYIILYAYPGRINKVEKKAIKDFAKRHNKKIVSFGMYQDIADIEVTVHPFELLAYFKHADFVITDTFHGSIFSIINHTKFCTIVRNNKDGNSNKIIDLLFRLDLKNRILTDILNMESMYKNDIDYSKTDLLINKEKEKTIEYLKDNLL